MSAISEAIERVRAENQIEALDWLISQTDSDMMGGLVRAWLIQQRERIKAAGGTPKK